MKGRAMGALYGEVKGGAEALGMSEGSGDAWAC
jgi:hypothetical protein